MFLNNLGDSRDLMNDLLSFNPSSSNNLGLGCSVSREAPLMPDELLESLMKNEFGNLRVACRTFQGGGLAFWTRNRHDFPRLSVFAQEYLAMPASQASVERLFSVAGCILSKRRLSLRSKLVDQLTFLRANGRRLGILTPDAISDNIIDELNSESATQ